MRWLPGQLSLRLVLASGLQLLLAGTALGLLGYATGRRESLERVSLERQRHQLTTLSDALSTRLKTPQTINQANLLAIEQEEIRLSDFDQMARHFWAQMQLYPVGYINYGSRSGTFIGVERLDDGQLVLNEDSERPLGRGRLGVYALGPRGERGRLLEVVPGMSTVHQEAWYADTVKANRPSWSRIYQWEDKPQVLAISYNAPVRDRDGSLLGVIGVDFVLNQLSTWLQQLWSQQTGLALVVEPNGLLVASSKPGLSLLRAGRGDERARLDQLDEPIATAAAQAFFVRQAARAGERQGWRLHQAALSRPSAQKLHRAVVGGQTYSLEAQPWGRSEGLNWLLITALSQDQALVNSQQQTLAALTLGALALVGAMAVNRQLIRWLLAPMQRLQQQAQAQLDRPSQPFHPGLPPGTALELQNMAEAFTALVQQLQRSRRELAEAAQREHLKDVQALELLKLKLRSSLEASAVAHEIKGPLSQILLSAQLIQQNLKPGSALTPRVRSQLNTITRAADEVVITIEKMRTLLRNVQTDHHPLNLAHVTRSALLYMKPALTKAQIALSCTGLEQPCPIHGDSAQLQIAIVNLLRNSLEALQLQPGGRQLQLRLEQRDGQAQLTIEDNGPGFPPLDDLLDPLQTNRPEGSGLGLFVVKTTLENHRGSIALGRAAIGGASVQLSLPLQQAVPRSG